MNLTDDIILKFQKGAPIFIDDICAIYPPTLGEIVNLGYNNFQQYLSILTATKPSDIKTDKELEALIENLTDFQFILFISSIDPKVNTQLKAAIKFFTREDSMVTLEPPKLYIGPLAEQHAFEEKSFYDFQRIIKRMCFLEQEGEEIIIYDDDLPQVKSMKLKMRESREKVRRAKERQNQGKESDMRLSDLIGSMTINDCGLNIINIWDMTYYAFHDQLKRMGWRDQFNINQKAALAGAKINKSQLKHWMRSIASGDK